MQIVDKSIVLFYKRLLKPGGAERLLLREYAYFKDRGYKVTIVVFSFSSELKFKETIDVSDIVVLNKKKTFQNVIALSRFMKQHRKSYYLCNSGYLDFYIASLLSNTIFSLHIHHPSFMSFNEKDKYSVFMETSFAKLVLTNHGAQRFVDIKKNLSFLEKLYINCRAFISIKAVRKAANVFVLSNYAKKEKKEMYNIDSYNYCGALEEEIFEYQPKKINGYENFKYKLISIARLDINKRLDELIKGFAYFLKKEPNSILLIGGTGNEYENLNELTKKLQIEDHVKFIGFVPDNMLYDYYAWADLFISIDWADFRITSYEAMAVGTKVLLSDETDPYDDLIKSGYYYLCPPTKEKVVNQIEVALYNENKIPFSDLVKILKGYTWNTYFQKIEKTLLLN